MTSIHITVPRTRFPNGIITDTVESHSGGAVEFPDGIAVDVLGDISGGGISVLDQIFVDTIQSMLGGEVSFPDSLSIPDGKTVTLFGRTFGFATVNLTHAEIVALFTTPKVLVAAAGANKVIFPIAAQWFFNGTVAYGTNTQMLINTVGATGGGNGINTTNALTSTAVRDGLFSQLTNFTTVSALAFLPNQDLRVTVANGNPALGIVANTMKIFVFYEIIDQA